MHLTGQVWAPGRPAPRSSGILSTRRLGFRLGGAKGVQGPGVTSRRGVGGCSRLSRCLAGGQVGTGPWGLGHSLVRQALLGVLRTGCVGVGEHWVQGFGLLGPFPGLWGTSLVRWASCAQAA